MRYSLLALAATTILGSASARGHAHRRHAHAHDLAPRFESVADDCACSTYVTSYLVDYTPAPMPIAVANATTTVQSVKTVVPIVDATSSEEEKTTTIDTTVLISYTSTALTTLTTVPPSTVSPSTVKPTTPATSPAGPVPTPVVTVIEQPGTYTIPATTITLTNTEYACAPETTSLAPGTQTYGGVTTIVSTSTTVVCPLATVEVEDGVTTSKIYTTTYICPSAGTYTIGATTSTVTGTVTVPCEYPVPTAYPPGTYIQPEVVTTITVTSQVVTCPLFTPAPTSEPTTVAAPVTTTAAPVTDTVVPVTSTVSPVTTSATDVPVSSVVATVIASSSTVSSAAPSQSSPAGGVISNGNLWAITYSPYSSTGGCKTDTEVESDIADIASKGFQNVRLYSTDCSGLANVGGSCEKHGLGIILGVFIKAGGVTTADSQVQDIIKWGKWDMITLFTIGNEAVFNGYCSASELAAYISQVASLVKSAGYKGSITTAEPLNILQANAGELCPHMDVVGANLHPFFNAGTTADQAGTFLVSQMKLASDACGGKPVWVLETGWPSSGQPNGDAVPGVAEQEAAIKAMAAAAPGQLAFFTYENDYWKAPGAYGVETSFGCAQLFK